MIVNNLRLISFHLRLIFVDLIIFDEKKITRDLVLRTNCLNDPFELEALILNLTVN